MAREPHTTLDGSIITELVRPEHEGSENLSVAQAVIGVGKTTLLHFHRSTEEVYYVLQGWGTLRIAGRQVTIGPGEAHLIRPGEEHSVSCIGETPLKLLCLCAPPYQHEDTVVRDRVVV